MNLFQILRYINHAVPIVIFDIAGISICSVQDKEDIDIDLYEYDILNITLGKYQNSSKTSLYITIQK